MSSTPQLLSDSDSVAEEEEELGVVAAEERELEATTEDKNPEVATEKETREGWTDGDEEAGEGSSRQQEGQT